MLASGRDTSRARLRYIHHSDEYHLAVDVKGGECARRSCQSFLETRLYIYTKNNKNMSSGGGCRAVGGCRPDPRGFLDFRRRADLRRTERKKDSPRTRSPASPAPRRHPPVWESREFNSRVASRLMASPDSCPPRASSSTTLSVIHHR
jgi:hypothetical protein